MRIVIAFSLISFCWDALAFEIDDYPEVIECHYSTVKTWDAPKSLRKQRTFLHLKTAEEELEEQYGYYVSVGELNSLRARFEGDTLVNLRLVTYRSSNSEKVVRSDCKVGMTLQELRQNGQTRD